MYKYASCIGSKALLVLGMGGMVLALVKVVVIHCWLLLMVQVLVKWSLVAVRHGLHVWVQLTHVDVMSSSVVVLMSLVIVSVVVVPRKVAVRLLIVSTAVEASRIGLDESQSNAKDDVKAWGKLYLSKQIVLFEHFKVTSKGKKTIWTGLMLWSYATTLS